MIGEMAAEVIFNRTLVDYYKSRILYFYIARKIVRMILLQKRPVSFNFPSVRSQCLMKKTAILLRFPCNLIIIQFPTR